MIGAVVLSLLAWVGVIESERPVLTFFGADETLLALAQTYMRTIRYAFPLFLFNQLLAAFLRNDGAPALATLGVLSGGVFNAFGDYFFVVACGMGIYGAGLATAIGFGVSFLVMLTHFFSRKNTLRLVKPEKLMCKLREIAVTGFSTFFIDVAMGILTVLFNRQIMKYLGVNALAIYGPIIQVSTFVQCCAYSVGQASQPIISTNVGAGKGERIRETLRLALWTTAFFGVFWTALSMACQTSISAFSWRPRRKYWIWRRRLSAPMRSCSCCSVQYLFDLLFSGDHAAEGGVHCVGGTWTCRQRRADDGAASAAGRGFPVAGYADYGAGGGGLCGGSSSEIHGRAA